MEKTDEKKQDKTFTEVLAETLADSPDEEGEANRIIADVIPLIDKLLSLKK